MPGKTRMKRTNTDDEKKLALLCTAERARKHAIVLLHPDLAAEFVDRRWMNERESGEMKFTRLGVREVEAHRRKGHVEA